MGGRKNGRAGREVGREGQANKGISSKLLLATKAHFPEDY